MYKLCPLIFFVLCWFNDSAQNIFYSPPVGNYPYSHAKIIGKVKENIVAYNHTWSHTFDMRHSEILVYDDEMRLLNKTSFKSIVPKICSLDFINERDRFCAVLQ